jgi:archaellum component FlaC
MALSDKFHSESGGNSYQDLNIQSTVNKIEVEVQNIQQRLDKLDGRMDKIDDKLDKIAAAISGNDTKVAILQEKVNTLEKELEEQRKKTDWIILKILGYGSIAGTGAALILPKLFS